MKVLAKLYELGTLGGKWITNLIHAAVIRPDQILVLKSQNDIFILFIFSCKNFVFVITFACSRMFLCILCTLRTLI